MRPTMNRILLADGNKKRAQELEQAFRRHAEQAEITVIESGSEVHEYFRERSPYEVTVALFGSQLTDMSSLDLLDQLLADAKFRTLPTIVLGDEADAELVHRCYTDGANAYVQVPASVEDFDAMARSIASFWIGVNVCAKPVLAEY